MFENENSTSLGLGQKTLAYAPGTTVRITQQIAQRDETYTTVVEGKILRQERQPSGSWYARNKDNKVWLDRLVLQKKDGEISILNLDAYSVIEVLEGPEPTKSESPLVRPSANRSANIT